MCGDLRPFTTKSAAVTTKSSRTPVPIIIPAQNKGVCTSCDVTVWSVCGTKLQIKWCKGCKNFRHWAAFGEKGAATKCEKCRTRQREKYKEQRDELKQKRKERAAVAELAIGVKEEALDETEATPGNKVERKSSGTQKRPRRKMKKRKTAMEDSSGLSHLIAAATQQS